LTCREKVGGSQRTPLLTKKKERIIMHVDKYVANNIGTKWSNGKSKKNQILGTIDGLDIDLKKLSSLLEEWNNTVNGEWSSRIVELVINVKEKV